MFGLPSSATDVPRLLQLRALTDRLFLGALLCLAGLNVAFALSSGMTTAPVFAILASSAVIGSAAPFVLGAGAKARLVLVVCVMLNYETLVHVTAHVIPEIDAHLLYFVLAALLTVYCCWATLLTASLTTATAHALFDVVTPDYFATGAEAWLELGFFLAVLVGESVCGAAIAILFHRLFADNHRAIADIEAAATERQSARAREDALRLEAERERESRRVALAEAAERQKIVFDQLADGLERLSAGSLTYRLDRTFPSEYEAVRANFNAALTRIGQAMALVVHASDAIRDGTGEISAVAETLAQGADRQSDSLIEAVAVLDEVSHDLSASVQGAVEAREAVADAMSDAQKSAAVVGEAIGAMTGIEESSRQIGQIIGVIDEIAFQTNLLALNAGVEAARAGEAGRGFAVVAAEVRALAQRSAAAAREIKTLIATSGAQVARGVDLVGRTGEALRRIVGEIGEISGAVSGMAEAVKSQSAHLTQVNTVVSEMDERARDAVLLFKRSAQSTQTLAQRTEELERQIGFFRVERERQELRLSA